MHESKPTGAISMRHLALATVCGLGGLLSLARAVPAAAQSSNPHIRVDAFGYRPYAQKTAVLREPITGHDAPDPYSPGGLIEVRRSSDGSVAYSGTSTTWNGGEEHVSSGDHAWWFDFSNLREEGSFYLYDPTAGISSESFEIDGDPYDALLVETLRMYYYQRCGIAKASPYAHPNWSDSPCHLGPEQDQDCRFVLDPSPSTSRDLSGGWHDAGDYNKYVNFADEAVHGLLGAYDATPWGWADDNMIPESSNGLADILDELEWELEWLLRMQESDGSVLHKVSVTDWSASSPPSTDGGARRYAPATASATISACGAYAHAAIAFRNTGDPDAMAFADQLELAALSAWAWLETHEWRIPSYYDNAGFVNAAAEDSPYWQEQNRTRAAVYLFALTGEAIYQSFVDAGYWTAYLFQWGWASPWEFPFQDGLLYYAGFPGATESVAEAIRDAYGEQLSGPDHLGHIVGGSDPYRAFLFDNDHTWGSNGTKTLQGLMFIAMNRSGLDVANAGPYLDAAEDYLHYLLGVNPPGWVYLTNLGEIGAERSVAETYHAWFHDGTVWDDADSSLYGPAPGLVTGGVNPQFAPDPAYGGPPIEPPEHQPILKSYRDWNADWPENSWQVTECHIPVQAAVVRLLAEFSTGVPVQLGLRIPSSIQANQPATFSVGGAWPGAEIAIAWSLDPGHFSYAVEPWCVDLGLALPLGPVAHRVCSGTADGEGEFQCTLVVPPSAQGRTLYFQAAQRGTCPYPIQSAVVGEVVQ
ncbi:MAG: LacI family transcriptional regulator [Gemmatimonadetes bacterium]|nr:LacI family transcriptional regulator [Gemmatimonadota bacterium]